MHHECMFMFVFPYLNDEHVRAMYNVHSTFQKYVERTLVNRNGHAEYRYQSIESSMRTLYDVKVHNPMLATSFIAAPCHAASRGRVDMLEVLGPIRSSAIMFVFETASLHGHVHVLQYLTQTYADAVTFESLFCKEKQEFEALDVAIEEGQLECVQYLVKTFLLPATTREQTNCLEFAFLKSLNWPSRNAKNITEYLYEHAVTLDDRRSYDAHLRWFWKALGFLNVQTCEWLRMQMQILFPNFNLNDVVVTNFARYRVSINQAFLSACTENRMDVLQLLDSVVGLHQCFSSGICDHDRRVKYMLYVACEHGYMDVLKVLQGLFPLQREDDVVLTCLLRACKGGQNNVIQFLYSKYGFNTMRNPEFVARMYEEACSYNRFDTTQFLDKRFQGRPRSFENLSTKIHDVRILRNVLAGITIPTYKKMELVRYAINNIGRKHIATVKFLMQAIVTDMLHPETGQLKPSITPAELGIDTPDNGVYLFRNFLADILYAAAIGNHLSTMQLIDDLVPNPLASYLDYHQQTRVLHYTCSTTFASAVTVAWILEKLQNVTTYATALEWKNSPSNVAKLRVSIRGACEAGNLPVVRLLMETFNITPLDKRFFPDVEHHLLINLCYYNHLHVIKYILETKGGSSFVETVYSAAHRYHKSAIIDYITDHFLYM